MQREYLVIQYTFSLLGPLHQLLTINEQLISSFIYLFLKLCKEKHSGIKNQNKQLCSQKDQEIVLYTQWSLKIHCSTGVIPSYFQQLIKNYLHTFGTRLIVKKRTCQQESVSQGCHNNVPKLNGLNNKKVLSHNSGS